MLRGGCTVSSRWCVPVLVCLQAKYIVCVGALLGIFTTTLIGVMGAARIMVGCCRERMLPPFFALVGKRRATPWVSNQ